MATVYMIQVSVCKWRIETALGHVLQTDITIEDFRAEDYVRNYVSSWANWSYEMRPLKKETK